MPFDLSIKEWLSGLAIALTLFGFYPYLRGILSNQVKPHVFSWVIWGVTTLVVFFAQLDARGGAGAWPIGLSGSITMFIAALAYVKRADIAITSVDWFFFAVALSSLPLWYFTDDPTGAVIVLTLVDLLGFGPTVRKAYAAPHAESLSFFGIFGLRNVVVILALESYSIATVLFPAAVALACALVMGMIVVRRRHE